ncbi:MAG: hypothetical protein ABJR46_02015 [Tateyamaria sp.]|uniref:hypothetical protein n=1 Tax=Tateyamaria sp. TaxID=1929288 RepID=UPI00329E4B0D
MPGGKDEVDIEMLNAQLKEILKKIEADAKKGGVDNKGAKTLKDEIGSKLDKKLFIPKGVDPKATSVPKPDLKKLNNLKIGPIKVKPDLSKILDKKGKLTLTYSKKDFSIDLKLEGDLKKKEGGAFVTAKFRF